MNQRNACGPERDPEFFEELEAVFARHPEAAGRYSVQCTRQTSHVLKVDFAKQVGVSRIDGGRIVTEFRDRDYSAGSIEWWCCEWVRTDGGFLCVRFCAD
ncbi:MULTISPECIES: hypothetical protein [unclassified Streptomyces]|uniref:hypothetical protein n=1 Tax=unclassified Streptomyces TaxID=2593676 RepID=UPI002E1B9D15|nr:hypothetical protein OG217_17855 [Streptomyces sp. NBC_01023]